MSAPKASDDDEGLFGRRTLLLIPHPDDEVVGAAAAIGRARARGGDVVGAYLTSGVPPSAGHWWRGRQRYPERAARRWQEAVRVADALGLKMASPPPVPARTLKQYIADRLDWLQGLAESLLPDRIWVPAYEGGHQDHDVTNYLGARLAKRFPVWEFSEYHFASGTPASQRFLKTRDDEVTIELDASERAQKRELLDYYASERANLSHIGLEREVFRPLAEYDYEHPPHPGRTFYQRFQWVPFHPRIDSCRPEEVCDAIRAQA